MGYIFKNLDARANDRFPTNGSPDIDFQLASHIWHLFSLLTIWQHA